MRKLALPDDVLLKVEKPARYIGGEVNSVIKDLKDIRVRYAMCFPDVYEIGMSHLGIQILYEMLNSRDDIWCERVYSPWPDLDKIMREQNIPLFGLESQDPIYKFDFLGITLQYEMCYTNCLQVLDLSHIPLRSSDRDASHPFVMGGGPCSYNPEPIADFFDIFYIGEGETVFLKLMDVYEQWKERYFPDTDRYLSADNINGHKKNESRAIRLEFLKEAAQVEGIYVPLLYDTEYNEDGTIKSFNPVCPQAPVTVKKQVVPDLTDTYYPQKPIAPYIQVTQDRAVLEIQRGCIRGCRFCQAGYLYRPARPRKLDYLEETARSMLDTTGHDEITLSSLSSSDYRELKPLVNFLIDDCSKNGVNVALPSLRIDAFSLDVMSRIQDIRKSSLTFAPEAGTQRMRDVINKGLTEDDILGGAKEAFKGGWNRVKLYFMLGLPHETYDDIQGIADLADKIARLYYDEITKESRKGRINIVVSTSIFVPKPFTAFQWSRMNNKSEAVEKRNFLTDSIKGELNGRSIKYNCHDAFTSELEGVFARGDRKLCDVILDAYKDGAFFDAWTDYFDYDHWQKAFEKNGIDMGFYIDRERPLDEIFPWDFIDAGVTKDFLKREYLNAMNGITTPNCYEKCSGCGMARYRCGICVGDY